MLLAIDCGNTNTVFALWDGERFVGTWRIATDWRRTADEYFVWLSTIMRLEGIGARIGEVIDIILMNEPQGDIGGFDVHPWHIHGGHVYDLGSGRGQYDPSAVENKLRTYTPILRDTTYLYRYTSGDGLNLEPYTHHGWRAWRLKVQDAG